MAKVRPKSYEETVTRATATAAADSVTRVIVAARSENIFVKQIPRPMRKNAGQ